MENDTEVTVVVPADSQSTTSSTTEPAPVVAPTVTLNVTPAEIAHIRDLMSVLLPPSGDVTLGQAIALQEGRPYVDTVLFRKVYRACEEAGVPVGQAAPDFGLALASIPSITVSRVTTTLLDEAGTSEAA